jgi:hypothetical protein
MHGGNSWKFNWHFKPLMVLLRLRDWFIFRNVLSHRCLLCGTLCTNDKLGILLWALLSYNDKCFTSLFVLLCRQPTLKPISAMKGSREKNGMASPTENRHVKWAPDVYDPPVTSVCHSVSSNYQYQRRSKLRKKEKERKEKEKREKKERIKQKKKEKMKSKKSQQNAIQNSSVLQTPDLGYDPAFYHCSCVYTTHRNVHMKICSYSYTPLVLIRLEDVSASNGQSSLNGLGKHEAVILDYNISKEGKCGSSFLRESVSKMHFSIAEAS